VVRGKKTLLAVFSRAGPSGDDVAAEEDSHASLLLRGPRTAAADAGFDASGRRLAGLDSPTASGRPSPLRSVARVASIGGSRPDPRGPVSPAPQSTFHQGARVEPPDFSPRAAEAARPWDSSTAEAPADAPHPR
jgi:hypothetical protein